MKNLGNMDPTMKNYEHSMFSEAFNISSLDSDSKANFDSIPISPITKKRSKRSKKIIFCVLSGLIVLSAVAVWSLVKTDTDSSSESVEVNNYLSDRVLAASYESSADCPYLVCDICHTNIQEAINRATKCPTGRADGSLLPTIDLLAPVFTYSETVQLGNSSLAISGAKYFKQNGTIPVIKAGFENTKGGAALFTWSGSSRATLTLEDMVLDGLNKTVSGLRSSEDTPLDFYSMNVQYNNFYTPNGVNGSAIFIKKSGVLYIDEYSGAQGNVAGSLADGCPNMGGENSEYCDGCTPYYGGGTVYIGEATDNFNIYGTYQNNKVLFNHGQGGGVHIELVSGSKNFIRGTFKNNQATEGGGISIVSCAEDVQVTIRAVFENNLAVDPYNRCGARGGAVTFRKVSKYSSVLIEGMFTKNNGTVYGGALRNDRIEKGGTLTLQGTFTENNARIGDIADIRGLNSGSTFFFNPRNMTSIASNDIRFSSDVCEQVESPPNTIKCEK
eukprot:CFRG4141T1